jgi:hypothetical protein
MIPKKSGSAPAQLVAELNRRFNGLDNLYSFYSVLKTMGGYIPTHSRRPNSQGDWPALVAPVPSNLVTPKMRFW